MDSSTYTLIAGLMKSPFPIMPGIEPGEAIRGPTFSSWKIEDGQFQGVVESTGNTVIIPIEGFRYLCLEMNQQPAFKGKASKPA